MSYYLHLKFMSTGVVVPMLFSSTDMHHTSIKLSYVNSVIQKHALTVWTRALFSCYSSSNMIAVHCL